MNKVLLFLLIISLVILVLFGFSSIKNKLELKSKTDAILKVAADKKISYGEGEYNKVLLKWEKTDKELFSRIMQVSASTNEIILLREYKQLMEELSDHIQEINKIEPPAGKEAIHQQLFSLSEYAYLTCLHYFKKSATNQYYFKKYVISYFQLYKTLP